jgi:hypothetical protein
MGVSVISGAISSDSWRQRFWMNTSISTYCILLLSCLVILEKQSHLHQRLVQHYSWCFAGDTEMHYKQIKQGWLSNSFQAFIVGWGKQRHFFSRCLGTRTLTVKTLVKTLVNGCSSH